MGRAGRCAMSEHDLKAALRRCHTLLQDAGHWIDMDAHADWHTAMDAELLVCDETGECPTVALPQPGEVDLTILRAEKRGATDRIASFTIASHRCGTLSRSRS